LPCASGLSSPLGKARLVHAELGKMIRECEDIRRDAAARGMR
jgi:hypothetical protein